MEGKSNMKVGIDIDGVLIDFEERLRYSVSMFDYTQRKNSLKKVNDSYWIQEQYGWSKEQWEKFSKKYLIQLTKESCLKPGAEEVLKLLKEEGNELIIISARGTEFEEMITLVKEKINKYNIKFDKLYWKLTDKLSICLDENIDIMIDDNPMTCEKLSKNCIKTFYFRNIYGKQLEENNYLKEVHNWAEIYKEIKEYLKMN